MNFHHERPHPLRCPFQYAKKHFPEGIKTFVEVGVYLGDNAVDVLRELSIEKTWLIDTWGENGFFLCDMRNLDDGNCIYEEIKERFRTEISQNKVEILRMDNREAANHIPNDLDLVYIDANHEYEEVKKDLEAWYPKVRKGGIFSGDDYHYYEGVVKAVDEFVSEHPGINLQIGNSKTQWWFIKEN